MTAWSGQLCSLLYTGGGSQSRRWWVPPHASAANHQQRPRPTKEPPRQPLLVNQRPDTSFPAHQEVGSTTQANKRPGDVFARCYWFRARPPRSIKDLIHLFTEGRRRRSGKLETWLNDQPKDISEDSVCLNFAVMQFMVWDSSAPLTTPSGQSKAWYIFSLTLRTSTTTRYTSRLMSPDCVFKCFLKLFAIVYSLSHWLCFNCLCVSMLKVSEIEVFPLAAN